MRLVVTERRKKPRLGVKAIPAVLSELLTTVQPAGAENKVTIGEEERAVKLNTESGISKEDSTRRDADFEGRGFNLIDKAYSLGKAEGILLGRERTLLAQRARQKQLGIADVAFSGGEVPSILPTWLRELLRFIRMILWEVLLIVTVVVLAGLVLKLVGWLLRRVHEYQDWR